MDLRVFVALEQVHFGCETTAGELRQIDVDEAQLLEGYSAVHLLVFA